MKRIIIPLLLFLFLSDTYLFAQTKTVSQLPEITNPAETDLLYLVKPGDAQPDRKITIENMRIEMQLGALSQNLIEIGNLSDGSDSECLGWNGGAIINKACGSGGGGGTPGGSTTEVQINVAGAFAGDPGLTYDTAGNILTVTGNVVVAGVNVCRGEGTNCVAPIVKTNANATWGAFTLDLGAVTTFTWPKAGSPTPTAEGVFHYNQTTDRPVFGDGSTTKTLFAVGDPASSVANTPAGNIAATNVQTALNELDTEKQAINANLTNISGLSCTGGIYLISANTFGCRTPTGHTSVLTITNADGVAGAPAFAIANSLIDGSSHFAADAGSNDTYVACPLSISTMSTPAYVDGSFHSFRANTANTGGATINLCGLGARDLVKVQGGVSSALNTNDIRVGQILIVSYRSATSEFQVQSTLGNVQSAAAAGADTECQFNDGGTALGGDPGCTYNKTTNILSVLGGVNTGDVSTNYTLVLNTATGARTATYTILGNYDIMGSSGAKTLGNCVKWDSIGRGINAGSCRKVVQVEIFAPGTANTTGDGKAYFEIPSTLNGMNLVAVRGHVVAVGTTGTLNVDIARCTVPATGNICSGTVADVLSTNLTIDSNEATSATAAAAVAIDGANDDVATGQIYRIDVDAIHTTPATGGFITMEFELP